VLRKAYFYHIYKLTVAGKIWGIPFVNFGLVSEKDSKKNQKSTFLSTFLYICIMETVNYTDFRSNLKHWFDKVVNDVSDIIIKRKNGKDLVLISLDEYNSLKETTYLLSGKNRDVLLNSIRELEAGKGVQNDLIEK